MYEHFGALEDEGKGRSRLGRGWLGQEQAAERLLCVCPQKDLACPKNGDVVFCVHRNHAGSKKLRRTIGRLTRM